MEPGLLGDSNKSSHPSAVVVHDSKSASEIPAAASEAPSIDNAALMKQLQESVATVCRTLHFLSFYLQLQVHTYDLHILILFYNYE